eukprot:TRINITY_DN24359_c0_g1_i1.p1 TRINITY_DN24359_c0_g1~~TRINITY_DN24359_c0_g1_i1.p1  ORF type:complete len:476 (+),score=76.34 TRINITY_DN24359_c0_g1_i1:58-1485(+)
MTSLKNDRLATMLTHVREGHDSVKALQDLAMIYDVKESLSLSVEKLNQIIVHFIGEMLLGLEGKPSSFKMLPSFVYKGDTSVAGNFMALDLGGTNFRVLDLALEQGKVVKEEQIKYEIPLALMKSDRTGSELFDFIAECVKEYLVKKSGGEEGVQGLGFTFSFPVSQTNIDSGFLITWTKGFSTSGCEGQDVVKLLRDAFQRQNINVPVRALVNDTVGTLVTGYFEDSRAEIGAILGTGSNACYWESVPSIKKLPSPSGWGGGDEKMCINIEWGNFDSINQAILPYTEMDEVIDKASPNRGKQRFEKLISGFYLGDIARLLLLKLVRHGVLPTIPCNVPPMSFPAIELSKIIKDDSPDLDATKAVLLSLYNYKLDTTQALTIKELFSCVTLRSARLAAAGIAAILLKTGNTHNAKVCIDGSVFTKTPFYKEQMEACLSEVLGSQGITNHNVELVATANGSGVGAALISALAVAKS